MTGSQHLYEVRPRKDKRGVDLISDVLPFGGLWYSGPNAASNAIDYAKFYSRSHDAVIRVYDESGNVIERGFSDDNIEESCAKAVCGFSRSCFRQSRAKGTCGQAQSDWVP
jgi:hypothetical protein